MDVVALTIEFTVSSVDEFTDVGRTALSFQICCKDFSPGFLNVTSTVPDTAADSTGKFIGFDFLAAASY